MAKDGSIRRSRDTSDRGYNTRIVSVPGGGVSKAVYFPIVPNTIGEVMLHVTATTNNAGDAVLMPLKVEVSFNLKKRRLN